MAEENILIDLKQKLELERRPHLFQQYLLLHYSYLLEKLTLCQLVHNYWEAFSRFVSNSPCVFTTIDDQWNMKFHIHWYIQGNYFEKS